MKKNNLVSSLKDNLSPNFFFVKKIIFKAHKKRFLLTCGPLV